MTTIQEVLHSIKSLAETQEKDNKKTQESIRETQESLRRTQEETQESIRETQESLRKTQEETQESIRETQESLRRTQEETQESLRKTQEETQESLRKTQDSLRKTQKELNKFIGASGHEWGRFIEVLTSTGVIRLLKQRGIHVEQTAIRLKDESSNRRYEIDVLATNGQEMVAIEAKKRLTKEDVDIAKQRFQDFKKYNQQASQKTLYGAVAYLECDKKVDEYAEKQGFFIFQVTGNSAVTHNTSGFKPISI